MENKRISDKIARMNRLLADIATQKTKVEVPSQEEKNAALDKRIYDSLLNQANELLDDIEIDNYIIFAGTLRGTTRMFKKRLKRLSKIQQ